MTRKKLLKQLQSLLGKSRDAKKKDIEKLHHVIKELKHKQKHLEDRLDKTKDEEDRHKILQNIEVIKLQREKGSALLEELRSRDGI
jgi:hypothetical protein